MGNIVHSSKHGSGVDWKGKRVLIVGACTSAHDVSRCVSYRYHVVYL
jgi:cation diffusion facilitator CzcD-associated flavoprotein CzcO